MKSNICALSSNAAFDRKLLDEVEKCAAYNGLDPKSSLRLTLLTEELIRMLPNLTEGFQGSFWLENEGSAYELHVSLKMENRDVDSLETFLSISKSGRNAASVGVMGKLRSAVEMMLYGIDPKYLPDDFYYMSAGINLADNNIMAWSLNRYIQKLDGISREESSEEWDELEKSVIAKLADDVVVGMKGKQVDIVVKKKF